MSLSFPFLPSPSPLPLVCDLVYWSGQSASSFSVELFCMPAMLCAEALSDLVWLMVEQLNLTGRTQHEAEGHIQTRIPECLLHRSGMAGPQGRGEKHKDGL